MPTYCILSYLQTVVHTAHGEIVVGDVVRVPTHLVTVTVIIIIIFQWSLTQLMEKQLLMTLLGVKHIVIVYLQTVTDTADGVCLFVVCLTSQQQARVSQGRICSDNFTYCHTEIEVADPTFHLTQSQYTDTGPTSPSTDPTTPGAWQGSHWSANF